MKSNSRRASTCIVSRPDAAGNLVPVGVQRAAPAGPRNGPFVVWDDQCQATRAGDTLGACAQYLCEERPDEAQGAVVYMGRSGPQPLNAAEEKILRGVIEALNEHHYPRGSDAGDSRGRAPS